METPPAFEYELGSMCYQTYPCQHRIRINGGKWKRMGAVAIYRLLVTNGVSHPHFEYCRAIVKQEDDPVYQEEQRQKRQQEREHFKAEEDKRHAAWEAKQAIIDQTKASSYLAKLKAKHNVA